VLLVAIQGFLFVVSLLVLNNIKDKMSSRFIKIYLVDDNLNNFVNKFRL
jgi:hypothetical protein